MFERAFQKDGQLETTTVDLSITDDVIRFYEVSGGPRVERHYGDFDHEYRVDIPTSDIRALISVLARRVFNATAPLDITDIASLCRAPGIPAEVGSFALNVRQDSGSTTIS